MSRFLTPLDVELVDDSDGGGTWVLRSPLAYESSIAGRVICAPEGFRTDFASVPRIPVVYWLTGDVAHAAAVIHDYLYSTGGVSRELADDVLLEAMSVTGVPVWRRYAMYWAVRAFGAPHFAAGESGCSQAPAVER